MELRRANRKLETEKLLALLRSETPNFFDIAEVVGKWVWIQFSGKQPPTVTRVLAELGFHWKHRKLSENSDELERICVVISMVFAGLLKSELDIQTGFIRG